jgi:hypothetical protein
MTVGSAPKALAASLGKSDLGQAFAGWFVSLPMDRLRLFVQLPDGFFERSSSVANVKKVQ